MSFCGDPSHKIEDNNLMELADVIPCEDICDVFKKRIDIINIGESDLKRIIKPYYAVINSLLMNARRKGMQQRALCRLWPFSGIYLFIWFKEQYIDK